MISKGRLQATDESAFRYYPLAACGRLQPAPEQIAN